jgi:GTP-binding protein
LGVLNFPYGDSCIIADIPGLIAGAHQGAGLGHTFLRHIERTRVLLHLIDSSGLEDDPYSQFCILEDELRKFKSELADRTRLILLNKIDLLEEDELAELINLFREKGIEVMPISAATGQGMPKLKEELEDLLV